MSQQGVLMGDGGGNPAGNDAMSTSGESVNQNIPPPPPGGEDVGGSLAPQDNVLPGVNTYGSGSAPVLQLFPNVDAQSGISFGAIWWRVSCWKCGRWTDRPIAII